MKDSIFLDSPKEPRDFEFNAQVAAVFDDMLARSVPFYAEQQRMFAAIASRFWQPGTHIYDLGCSTATTLIGMAKALPDAFLTGYDNSEPMLQRAREKVAAHGLQDRVELRSGDLNAPLASLSVEAASVVTMCWTLQFVRPLQRDALVRWIYDGLLDGGALIVAEKVLANNSSLNRLFIEHYYDYKRQRSYTENEIARKREALENVLIPYRPDENIELFRRNGFQVVETFFQWFNFAAFLCLKAES